MTDNAKIIRQQTVFVSGAEGFIGSNLCVKLQRTYVVIAGCHGAVEAGMEPVLKVFIDLKNKKIIETVVRDSRPDVIIHCAGIAHQKIGSIDFDEYQRINSLASENLAKAAITANPDVHFIFLSSISVYGEDSKKEAVLEGHECNPSSDYAYSKLDAEKRLVKLFNSGKLKKLDILRLAPVYDSEWSLNLDRRVFAHKKIAYIKFGSGEQEMSAISRQNLVDFIDYRLTLEEEHSIGKPFCNIFNICDVKPYKFEEMIRVFKQSEYYPDRLVLRVPLSFVWIATRLAGLIIRSKRQWLHSCYDKLAHSLVFDNKRMLDTGFKPKHNLESVFLKKEGLMSDLGGQRIDALLYGKNK